MKTQFCEKKCSDLKPDLWGRLTARCWQLDRLKAAPNGALLDSVNYLCRGFGMFSCVVLMWMPE